MARILIAWELGEAFGHLARCLRLAQALSESGHSVVLVLKSVRLPAGHALRHDITVLQAPLTPSPPASRSQARNYAEVLLDGGFADVQDLAARLRSWHGIYALVRPELVIADHAPTALLAAGIADIPKIPIGNGFAIPPSANPWPSIRPWDEVSDGELHAAEVRLNSVTAAAQTALGLPTSQSVREHCCAGGIVDCFPELDPYPGRDACSYIGPIGSLTQAKVVAWQFTTARRILVYLRPQVPGFVTIMRALKTVDAEVLCVAPGMPVQMARQFATRNMRISLVPLSLEKLFEKANLAISYGNSGFSAQALLAGVPLLMRPRHVEQALFARRVEAMGAGIALLSTIDADQVAESVARLLSDPAYAQAAGVFQTNHQDYSPTSALQQFLCLVGNTLMNREVDKDRSDFRITSNPRPECLH